jgi:hypothetical protein
MITATRQGPPQQHARRRAPGAHEFESGAQCGRGGDNNNGDALDCLRRRQLPCGSPSCQQRRLPWTRHEQPRGSSTVGTTIKDDLHVGTERVEGLEEDGSDLLSNLGEHWQCCREGRSTTLVRTAKRSTWAALSIDRSGRDRLPMRRRSLARLQYCHA